MADKPGTDEFVVETEKTFSKEEEELLSFFASIKKDSLQTLEEAARQLIGLVTTLLGVFFGVLAISGDSSATLVSTDVKIVGAISLVAYMLALWFALEVVMPRRLEVPAQNLTAMRSLLAELFERKSSSLFRAQTSFTVATLALMTVTMLLLIKL